MITLRTVPTPVEDKTPLVENKTPPIDRALSDERAHAADRSHDARARAEQNADEESQQEKGGLQRPSDGFDPANEHQRSDHRTDDAAESNRTDADHGHTDTELANGQSAGGQVDDSLSVSCPVCRARVERHRRFCDSCFAEMQPSNVAGGQSKFVSRRSSSQGPGRRTVAWLVVAGLLGFSVVALVLSSPGEAVKRRIVPASEPVAYTVSLSGSASVRDGELDRLGDGDDGRGVALDWTTSLAAEPCNLGSAPALMMDFDPGSAPTELRIVSGIEPVDSAESPLLWPGPRRMSVVAGEWCGELDLGSEPGEVRLALPALARTGQLTLLIHDRWDTGRAQVYSVIAIGEIELLN